MKTFKATSSNGNSFHLEALDFTGAILFCRLFVSAQDTFVIEQISI